VLIYDPHWKPPRAEAVQFKPVKPRTEDRKEVIATKKESAEGTPESKETAPEQTGWPKKLQAQKWSPRVTTDKQKHQSPRKPGKGRGIGSRHVSKAKQTTAKAKPSSARVGPNGHNTVRNS
jgi:hypothetical protein